MTTMIKIGIGAAIVATAVMVVPALKGPYNRFKNEANDKLNSEYVVDNYKAEYVKLYEQRAEIQKSISKFDVEKKIAIKKLTFANDKLKVAKDNIKIIGISDLKAFARAKDAYELAKTESDNFGIMVNTYSQAVVKLEKSLALIEVNMAKAKLNVDTLASKKTMLDTIRNVNKSIKNMNGIGNTDLAINVEKLDDDMLRESIRLEALDKSNQEKIPLTEADAKAYIDNLK